MLFKSKLNRLKNVFLVAMAAVILFACGQSNKSKTPLISGQINNLDKNKKLYLYELLPKQSLLVDSTFTKNNGDFAFTFHNIDQTGYYRVMIGKQYLTLIVSPKDQIKLTVDAKNVANDYTVKGSKASEEMMNYNKFIRDNFKKRDSLNQVYQANASNPKIDSIKASLQAAYEGYYNELQTKAAQLINKKPGSFLALAAVQQLDKNQHYDLYAKVDSAFQKLHPKSPYFQPFHATVAELMKLAPGSVIPDIMLPDTSGKTRKLSSLRGHVVLVDFWASWCRPCRHENPNVVKAYKTYHPKGFDIYSVSLDGLPQQSDPKADWEKAIKQDGLIWPNQVSSLSGWKSPVVPIFQFNGIPYNILIDKNGKIIAKNLRGEALQKELAKVFG